MTTRAATEYWKGQKSYPLPFTKRRRIHELNTYRLDPINLHPPGRGRESQSRRLRLYRTITRTHDLIARNFCVTAVDRVYPDELEFPFDTKQFYFEGRRRP